MCRAQISMLFFYRLNFTRNLSRFRALGAFRISLSCPLPAKNCLGKSTGRETFFSCSFPALLMIYARFGKWMPWPLVADSTALQKSQTHRFLSRLCKHALRMRRTRCLRSGLLLLQRSRVRRHLRTWRAWSQSIHPVGWWATSQWFTLCGSWTNRDRLNAKVSEPWGNFTKRSKIGTTKQKWSWSSSWGSF
jgi:hypothetical protein